MQAPACRNCLPCVPFKCEPLLLASTHLHCVLRNKCHAFASLGFTSDPRPSIERTSNALLRDAASLLLYQAVLKVPAAQAFLKLLLALRRGEDGWKLLDAYGEFYKNMVADHISSWEDLILEGILLGDGNPFAEACASIGNLHDTSRWSGEIPHSLQAAAASDLDCLQRLSIAESTLVGWVAELVPDVRQEWKVAAGCTLFNQGKKVLVSAVNPNHSAIDAEAEDQDFLEKSFKGNGINKCLIIEDTLTPSDRRVWHKKIGGLWKWSEAVPLLLEYYSTYGTGRSATEQALECKGGKLLRHSGFSLRKTACHLSYHYPYREKLTNAFERHARGHQPGHVLVQGASGSGKTWLVQSTLYEFVAKGDVKSVVMPKNELKHLQSVFEELGKNWQLRFVLVMDSMTNDLSVVQQEWPDNVLVCALRTLTVSSEVTSDHSDMFGTILTLHELDMSGFLQSVQEILQHSQKGGVHIDASAQEQAISWASDRKALSIRGAAQFARYIA